MQYTLYVILAPLIAAALLATMFHALRYRAGPGTIALIWVVVSAVGWLVVSTLELLAPTPAGTIFWSKFTSLSVAILPVAWLAFAQQYIGRGSWPTRSRILLLSVIPFATVVLDFTNELHHLVWRDQRFFAVGSLLIMQITHGTWFWVQTIYGYSLLLWGTALILRAYVQSFELYRRQALWVMIGVLSSFIFSVIYVFRLLPRLQQDYSPIGFAFTCAAFVIGMMRYRLFDLKPVARNALIDSMEDGMLVLDERERVVDINPAARNMIGVGSADVVGEPIAAVLGAARSAVVERFQDSTAMQTEITFDQDGVLRYLDLRVSRLTDHRGQLTGRLIVLRDITGRKVAELGRDVTLEELRLANAALQARNEELDAFAHTVAHDLKNPLGAIMGYAALLAEEGDPLPVADQRAAVETIERLARQMGDIIEALLLLAGVRRMPVEPVSLDMAEIVDRALDRLAGQVQRSAATISAPRSWPAASGFAPWVEEVWYNYLSNALKYGGRPPRVELGADLSTEAGPDAPPSDMVRFWIQDNGDGLTPEAQDRLFVPFTRLGLSRAEGHGLGLSIARQIVEKLGGEAGVESAGLPGRGSRFYFTLPAAERVTSDV